MMQLVDNFSCKPLREEVTTARIAWGRSLRPNCHDTHLRARGAKQNRCGRILLSHILILLSCCLALAFCGRIRGATTATASVIASPTPGSTLTAASTTFTWNAGSAGTTGYGLNVGTTPGGADLVNIGPLAGTSVMVNLPTNGATIYVRLWTEFSGATYLYNDYTYTEFSQSASAITSPAPGSTLTAASTTFAWNAGPAGTTGYGLNVGTSAGGANLVNIYPLPGTSTTVTLPTNGATIYVRLWTVLNGTTFLYNDYTYSAASSSSTLSALTCGSGSMTGTGTDSCTVTLNAAATTGGLAVSLASNNSAVIVPASATVAAGSTTGSFTASVSAVSSAQTVTLTASANSVAKAFTLQLGASGAALSTLTCASGSMTGAGTDRCTVKLNAAAPSGGMAVSLASNNSAVTVPASVTVAAKSKSASFTATVSSVSNAQTVTLTASAKGVGETFALQLGTSVPVLSALTCVSGSMTGAGSDSCTATLNAAAPSGGFAVSLASNNTAVVVPASVSVAAGATTASFTATVSSVSTAQTVTLTANANSVAETFALQLGTSVPVLNALTCVSGSMTGAGTDSCTATLNAAAPSGGFAVSLASNNTAVTVPASVTAAAGSTTASFTATVSSVSTAQTVTLTANANSVAKTFALQLGTGVATLSVNATTITFGNVSLNSPATQTLILTSTGTAAVTVSAGSVSGSGFTVSGGSYPITLSPNQTATLSAQFDPTVAGAATGQLTITSNSSTGSSTGVSLSGTGVSVAYEVNLTWDAPTSSPDPVAGYNVYRAPSGSTNYQQINSATVTQTAYADTTVVNSQTYDYIVESVDASEVTSAPSNMAAVPVP